MKNYARQMSCGIWTGIALLAIFGLFGFFLLQPKVIGRAREAKLAAAKSDMATFDGRLKQFQLDCDRYPTTAEGFTALWKQPKGLDFRWKGPYANNGNIPIDPWGEPYVYTAKPKGYQIVSKGPNHHPIVDNG